MTIEAPQSILLSKIYLDPENPRHETLPDEPSIIKHLVAREKVRPLAKDIAEAGGTSPIELIALIHHPKVKNAFVVVEGNRRICALKLLQDPDKAGSEKETRYFGNLAQNMRHSVNKVPAIVFDSRESAQRWFSLRHEGEQDGVGTKAWDSDQKTRFSLRTQGKNPNAQALLVLDYARQYNLLTVQELAELSITTLTRYLSNPVVRHALGLADGNTLDILVPDAEFERALTRFLRDALSPQTSGISSRTSATERKAYAATLTRDGVAAATFGAARHTPRTGGGVTGTQPFPNSASPAAPGAAPLPGSAAGGATPGGHDNRNPDKRAYVIPPSFKAHIKHKQLKRLYDELKSIDAKTHSFSATYLLRAVIENGIATYLSSKAITPKRELHEKYKQLVKQLESEGMDRELKFLRTIMQNGKDDPNSPDTMGHYIHGGATPPANYTMRYWDNMEPIMARVLTGI